MSDNKSYGVVDAAALQPGTRVQLADGTIMRVTSNPGDGVWLFGEPDQRGDGDGSGREEPIFADDIKSALP